MTRADDQRELDGLRSLDPQVISAVYERYFQVVYRFIFFRVGDAMLAEDLTGEVFLRLLQAARSKRAPEVNLKGWLLGTSAHTVNDHFRGHYRQPLAELPENLEDPDGRPAEEVEHRENQNRLREAMTLLTPEQQQVITLRFGDGFSLEETASLMNKKVNAIKQLQLRALAALNRKIGGPL
jgi:RNA polymerase sigma-70 factor (ECF subfamily)